MGYGNPVRGEILPNQAPWPGTPTFRVTSTYAQHAQSGRALGLDIGNGRCGDQIIAAEAGTARTTRDPNGALIVRIKHAGVESTGYAHMSAFLIPENVNVQVKRGQPIGTLGKTGASACHLHFGVNRGGREVDPWPLLEQNELPDSGTGGDVKLKGTVIEWIHNRTTHLTAAAGFTEDPTAMPYNNLVILPNGTAFTPSVKVRGNTLAGTNEWYGGWITGNPPRFGYIILANCGPLVAIEQAGGYTQAQLDAAVDKAEFEGRKEGSTETAAAAVEKAKQFAKP